MEASLSVQGSDLVKQELNRLSASLFIEGKVLKSASTELIPVIDPATGLPIGKVAEATPAEISKCLLDAKTAWKDWHALSAQERASALHQVTSAIRDRKPVIAELMTREMGKPYKEAIDEVEWCTAAISYYAELARHDAGRVVGNTVPGQFQYVVKEPLGVVGLIMPFNFPLVLLAWEAAAALAAGNAVIVKPSELTSLSTLLFVECFASSLPPGLLSCVTGRGNVGAQLVSSPHTSMIGFTGSVATGQLVAEACARQFKRCLIEASGNDPFIVMPSAKLDVAARAASFAAFVNNGQVCTSAERLLIHRDVHDAFVGRMIEETSKLRIGNGLDQVDLGPMASERERARFEGVIARAVEQGARIVCGGKRPNHLNAGFFHEPTILVDVRPDMDIMKHEPFGPVAAICRVDSFEDAIRVANASDFGLGATIYTSDLNEAHRAVAELESGMVWVNAPLLDNPAGPFGGRKMSGIGRQLGLEGLETFRESKFVMIDPAAPAHDFWWFPYSKAEAFASTGV
ncbi:aldehyde dehydrogenase family protein [Hyphomicrobium facile]|uniref:Betaine-aldehyde dehydrogenase n=1 Tax=Hyphomicrobium facile TaxID=51670 RepID=A0A1I7NDT9_9HYPH|nr:aldehyde dehydrogenase family protein [Hyphomicrobium facile]SFV32819.1 betaine-aldehyde dehydrogenase [Hyphomicrobium facile]